MKLPTNATHTSGRLLPIELPLPPCADASVAATDATKDPSNSHCGSCTVQPLRLVCRAAVPAAISVRTGARIGRKVKSIGVFPSKAQMLWWT